MWFILALFSAVFAALTSILAKIGIDGVNSNLATAIRTVIVLIMSWGMVFITNSQNTITSITNKSWLFLVLSGLAPVFYGITIDTLVTLTALGVIWGMGLM